MLYHFDTETQSLDALDPTDAAGAGVLEKQIEQAVANKPETIFKCSAAGEPVLIVRTSVSGQKMPDIIALDGEGRIVLVECKRGWADRQTLAQLLDYASDYSTGQMTTLERDWSRGRGRGSDQTLIEAFRTFIDDPGFDGTGLGQEQVLVVVASGEAPGFGKITNYLAGRGVPVYLVSVKLYQRNSGEMYLDVEPIELAPVGHGAVDSGEERAWMVNTDQTHSIGAWKRFISEGVAGVWGFPTLGATLEQGAKAGDTIYAYLNGKGIVAQGSIVDGEVLNVKDSVGSIFPECEDSNEWHLAVEWTEAPGASAVSNREVRETAGAGLPVRNTFCRLWNPAVRKALADRWPMGTG